MSTVAEPIAAVRTTAAPESLSRHGQSDRVFTRQLLGAEEIMRFEAGGSIPHAEIRIGERILLADEWPEGGRSALKPGHSPVHLVARCRRRGFFPARAVALA